MIQGKEFNALVNYGILFMYAGQAVSDCNRDYVEDSFAKREPREHRSSRTKPHAETARLFYDILISGALVTTQIDRNNSNEQFQFMVRVKYLSRTNCICIRCIRHAPRSRNKLSLENVTSDIKSLICCILLVRSINGRIIQRRFLQF